LELWAAPGAPETIAKGGGRSPPPSGMVSRAPEAAQTPQMADLRSYKIEKYLPKYNHDYGRAVFQNEHDGASGEDPPTLLPTTPQALMSAKMYTASRTGSRYTGEMTKFDSEILDFGVAFGPS
jgi:hypothetical protein